MQMQATLSTYTTLMSTPTPPTHAPDLEPLTESEREWMESMWTMWKAIEGWDDVRTFDEMIDDDRDRAPDENVEEVTPVFLVR